MEQHLTIYFTSDLHGFFFPTNYADHTKKSLGLLQCASQFKKDNSTLVIDGGDILQGSAFTYYCKKILKSSLPIAHVMNQCNYDYVTLGNHDFNYGFEYTLEYLNNLEARCVCQNIKHKDGTYPFSYDIRVMDNGLRVLVMGLVTDYVNIWETKENLNNIQIVDPFSEAKQVLSKVEDQVDLSICIYHGGFEREIATGRPLSTTSENIAYKICEELNFDLLLTGHQHMTVNGQWLHGTFIVQPKEKGLEYHKIEVSIKENKKTIQAWLLKPSLDHILVPTDDIMHIEQEVQTWLDKELGRLEKALVPEDKLRMAQYGSEIADLLNQIQLYYTGAQISATSLANDCSGFQEVVTRRDILATYPYSNTLMLIEITGEKLWAAIQRSAEYFDVDGQGDLCISKKFLEPKVEHYNFDFYAGIEYKLDPLRAVGDRVVQLCFHGIDIKNTDSFLMCINNYRASGAGGYDMYVNCGILEEVSIEMVELIMDYFEDKLGEDRFK